MYLFVLWSNDSKVSDLKWQLLVLMIPGVKLAPCTGLVGLAGASLGWLRVHACLVIARQAGLGLWFSTGGDFATQGALGNVWTHFGC